MEKIAWAWQIVEQSQPMIHEQLDHNQTVVDQMTAILEERIARLKRENPEQYRQLYETETAAVR